MAAYLYGSIPFVYLLGRRRGIDLRATGSGNVGSTNLRAGGGASDALLGWLLDASKGLLPVAVCRRLGLAEPWAGVASVAGVAGQCWPLFLRFNGGRGIAPFIGAAFMIDRGRWAVSLLPFIIGGLWRVAGRAPGGYGSSGGSARSRSKSVPLGCALGVAVFAGAALLPPRPARHPAPTAALAPLLLAAVVLLRRATAPLPDDAERGPRVRRAALLYRLLYDRNTGR